MIALPPFDVGADHVTEALLGPAAVAFTADGAPGMLVVQSFSGASSGREPQSKNPRPFWAAGMTGSDCTLVPSAFATTGLAKPFSQNKRPAGVQPGYSSCTLLLVICVGFDPSTLTVQTSRLFCVLSTSKTNASFVPSGDQRVRKIGMAVVSGVGFGIVLKPVSVATSQIQMTW